MAKFSLQRVLELKERREQAEAMKLSEARTAAEAARSAEAAIEALRRARGAGEDDAAPASVSIGQMQNASYVRERLDQWLAEARTAVREADARVNACLAEFTVASRERTALDRLKLRKLEAAAVVESEAERKVMDGIALSRYFRSDKSSAGGDK